MMRLAITNGSVFDSHNGNWIHDGVLVAENGVIKAVGPQQDVTVPPEAQRIDAAGGYVIPGLIDAHNHLGIDGDEVEQIAEPDDITMFRSLRNAKTQLQDGVTTLRDMGAKSDIDFHLRDIFSQGQAPGPRLLCSGPWITTPHGHCAYPRMLVVSGTEEVRRAVRQVLHSGADQVKLMVTGGVSSPTTDPSICYWTKGELAVAAEEAHNVGRPVAAHCFGGLGLRLCIEAGIDTIEHGILIQDDEEINMVKNAGKIVVTTLSYLSRGLDPANPTGLPPAIVERVHRYARITLESIRRMSAAGVRFAVGGDSIHDDHAVAGEAHMLVECGRTPLEALLAATKGGAEACSMADQIGSLDVGKRADAVILAEDPLLNIAALRGVKSVIKDGELVFAKDR